MRNTRTHRTLFLSAFAHFLTIGTASLADESATKICDTMFQSISEASINACLSVAEKASATTQYSIGRLYDDGIIDGIRKDGILVKTQKNPGAAIKWYKLAAQNGDDGAAFVLGNKFLYGNGIAKNYSEAISWFKIAVKNKNEEAPNMLEVIYGDSDPFNVATGFQKNNTIAYMWALIAYTNIQTANPSKEETHRKNVKDWERKLTPQQVASGQAMAKTCISTNYSKCE